MKKILGLKGFLNITVIVMLVGGLVFTFGFGLSLYLARHEVSAEVNKKVELDMNFVNTYIDGNLQRVEDVAYTVLTSKFGASKRNIDGKGVIAIDPETFQKPSEEECFVLLEHFLDANPYICGAAIGFEKDVYPDTKGQYGFAAYVTNVSGEKVRLKLGEIHDYRQKEWYHEAASKDSAYWSNPFRETSRGKIVTCYSLPLHGYKGRLIGVLAVDINTDTFRDVCKDIAPFPSAEVTLTDRQFRFICHPDTTFLLKSVSEVGAYSDYKADDSMRIKMQSHQAGHYSVNEGRENEALFYFMPNDRTGWTISIECPKKEVFGGVDRMKRDTTWIAIVSILIMIVCFVWLFRKMQAMVINKAGMESELNVASGIQMGMIPKIYPAFPGREELDVYGFLKPAKTVGGDLYYYFVRDEKLFFCIGDVSGKGIPASLFMMVILALFRNVSHHTFNPAHIMDSINTSISEGNEHCMFCTMFTGVLDLKTGHLDYCNAGHNAPVIRRITEEGVKVDYMQPKKNLPVGVFGEFEYELEHTTLKPGEAIFMYTDGVTEAENVHHQLFGEERTLAALLDGRAHGLTSSKEIIDNIYKNIEQYAAGMEQSDDITMVVVEYQGMKENKN